MDPRTGLQRVVVVNVIMSYNIFFVFNKKMF